MTAQVRAVREEELQAYLEAMSTAFLERPDVAKVADDLKSLWDLSRVWAAFDGERIVGTFRSWATEITVPGGDRLPASAVSAVTVLPTHRRRGILRRMAATDHAAARERGEAIAALYASEYAIYGRFGYGPATHSATWTVDALAAGFGQSSSGGVEIVPASEAAAEQLRHVFDAWRVRQPGELARPEYRWLYELGLRPSHWEPDWKGFLALHRGSDGDVDGYVRYRAEEKWENRQPRNVIKVDELHALNAEAYDALWGFLIGIDLVSTIRAARRRLGERLPWLLSNHRAAVASDVGDGLWVLLLDVPRALTARGYEREAQIVLEVVGGEGDAAQRLELEAAPDGATCRPTDRAADLTLHLSALGAAYLGGTRLRDAVLARGFDEHRPGALAEADALFRTGEEPWCSTPF